MYRIVIIFTLFSCSLAHAQTSEDYRLYSKVLQDYVNEGTKYNAHTTKVIVIDKFNPTENWASNYGENFINGDMQLKYMSLAYDSIKIKAIENTDVQNAILALEAGFFDTPFLDSSKFMVRPSVQTISNKEFRRYYGYTKWKRQKKGWTKFYKRYPGAHGIFQFSKVAYSGQYACYYVGRHSSPLSGSGDLIILKRGEKDWEIVTDLNIWMA